MRLFRKVSRVTELLQREGNSVQFQMLRRRCVTYLRTQACTSSAVRASCLATRWPRVLRARHLTLSGWNRRMPEDLATALLKVGAISTGPEAERIINEKNACLVPVVGAARRVGTIVLVRMDGQFSDNELVLFEFVATVIGMVIATAIDEAEEDEAEEKRMARSAIRSLSYSEVLAMQHIFDELDGDEGLLVASRIADQAGITRSVIVNALRKLASANVIESRSLGMKGTYLRILNRKCVGSWSGNATLTRLPTCSERQEA